MTHRDQPAVAPADVEEGVIVALLKRLTTQRLPRLLALKAKVTRGERLDAFDITFMNEVLEDARTAQAKWADHSELAAIIARVTELYHEITERVLADEDAISLNRAHP